MFTGTTPSAGTVDFVACRIVKLLSYGAFKVAFFDLVTRRLPLPEAYAVWQSFGVEYGYSDLLQQLLSAVANLDMGHCMKLCDASSQFLLCLSISFFRSCL